MKSIYSMTEAESEVMEKLWDQEESIKQSHLLTLFEEDGKEWKDGGAFTGKKLTGGLKVNTICCIMVE